MGLIHKVYMDKTVHKKCEFFSQLWENLFNVCEQLLDFLRPFSIILLDVITYTSLIGCLHSKFCPLTHIASSLILSWQIKCSLPSICFLLFLMVFVFFHIKFYIFSPRWLFQLKWFSIRPLFRPEPHFTKMYWFIYFKHLLTHASV